MRFWSLFGQSALRLKLVFGRRRIGRNAVEDFIHLPPVHALGARGDAGASGRGGDLHRKCGGYHLIHTDVLSLGQFSSLPHERIWDVHL
jgi:hypothetical protein